jgi:nicotinamidase-related amidase
MPKTVRVARRKRASLNKRTVVLGKGTRYARKNKSRRRIRMIVGGKFTGIPTGTNDFANYYLKKYAEDVFKEQSPIKPVGEIKKGSILWVIDMQNDFIDLQVDGLKGPSSTGAFSVSEGKTVIDGLVEFMNANKDKFNKIIFTRDWHPEDHCSFSKEQIGTFPPHCIWNSIGAAFNETIKTQISINKKDNKFIDFTCNGVPVDILFKGYHKETDSFSGVSWTDDKYPFKNRQLTTCCQTLDCKNNTGGRKLKPEYIASSLETELGEYEETWVEDSYELPKPIEDGQIYVVGLAGEFCVKDTAIMLKNSFPEKTVNVVQDLTRYVFLPVFVTFQRYPLANGDNSEPCDFGKLLMRGEWINDTIPDKNFLSELVFENTNRKPLSTYLFSYNPSNPTDTKRLEQTELEKYKNEPLSNENGDPTDAGNNLWHFCSDHRILLKDYYQFGVNLLMDTKPKAD